MRCNLNVGQGAGATLPIISCVKEVDRLLVITRPCDSKTLAKHCSTAQRREHENLLRPGTQLPTCASQWLTINLCYKKSVLKRLEHVIPSHLPHPLYSLLIFPISLKQFHYLSHWWFLQKLLARPFNLAAMSNLRSSACASKTLVLHDIAQCKKWASERPLHRTMYFWRSPTMQHNIKMADRRIRSQLKSELRSVCSQLFPCTNSYAERFVIMLVE